MQRILGQDRAITTLLNALRGGRLHHAWIFSGPRGVGKCTTALEFAKILLDPNASTNLAGELESDSAGDIARMIDAESHPDLHMVRKELALFSDNTQLRGRKLITIPLDVLRERVIGGKTGDNRYHEAPAYRKAMLGHGKVFIIDEAELIDRTGQNSLLKTLEEPPPRTYLFLITSRPEQLLPTVFSRCQHIRFGPLDDDALQEWFNRSGLEVDGEERRWIERFCDGSPGIAKLGVDYGFCAWHRTLAPMLGRLDRGEFPASMGALMAELIEAFATTWVKRNKNASKDAANKAGARHMFSLLASHVRQGLVVSCDGGEDPSHFIGVVDLLQQAERQLASNVNLKQLLENLVVQWACAARAVPA